MNPSPLLLGIDVGSSGVKAVVVDEHGDETGWSSADGPFTRRGSSVEAPVVALRSAVARAVAGLGDARRQVVGVGVAGMSESGAPLDDAGRPLAPVIAWHDPRGGEVAARLEEQFGPELTTSIGQRLRAVSTVAKLGWLLEQGVVDEGRGIARWLGVPELVLRALTGADATEWSLAARTGCFDVGRRVWLPAVAEAAGFDVAVFADIRGAGSEMGRVSTEGGAWSGLPAGVPATVAGHDHLVGTVGSGAAPEDLVNSVGTAETVVARSPVLPDMDAALSRRLAVSLFPGADGWVVLASAARAGLAVEAAAAALERSPAELDGLAAAVDPAPLEAPHLLDSLRRREDPALPAGPPGAVWRTLLDALALCTGEAVDRLTQVVGPAARLVVFGGGARSRPWNEARAARAGLPVWRTGAREAVARGAAIYAGVAAGWWASVQDAPRPELGRLSAAHDRE